MNKKIFTLLLIITFVFTLFLPKALPVEAADKSFNTERYGDVLDIGTKLRKLESDPEYRAELDKKIKEMAATINFDEEVATEGGEEDDNFTFEGDTKWFLGYDGVYGYYYKTYTLRSVGENVEVWVARDLSFEDNRPLPIITQEQVDHMKDIFDETVYPTDTSFFGTPNSHTGENSLIALWNGFPEDYYAPYGGEEKVMILVDNVRDENYYDPAYPFYVAGFFSSSYEDYFDRNIISIDTNNWEERLDTHYLPTTAHEFQHLIHNDNDPFEETWIDEGMADFAEYLCFGEHAWGHVNFFLDHPENSLVEWDDHYTAETGPETLADYGQAYLLQLYMNDKYGKDFIQMLAKDQDQGFTSINKVLNEFGAEIDFEELFRRFTLAVAIDSPQPGEGIYNFDSIDLKVNYESAAEYDKDGVPAWGGDYKILNNEEKIRTIVFDGIDFMPTPWKVVSDPLGSGENVLWGNNGHLVDNQIVFEADLSGLQEATLRFDTFIDIEPDWDAGMVQVSTDNGDTWTSLANEDTISQDNFTFNEQAPQVYNNLPGFSMQSGDWIEEIFNLNDYVGQKIYINFRYMTDAAYNDTGWFIDNIEIPELGYLNNCSNMNDFISLDELKEIHVDYAVSFINETYVGKGKTKTTYRVININPFNITEEDAIQLRQIFKDGQNYMVVWYAAPAGKKGVADYEYEITTMNDFKGKKPKK